MKKNLYKSMILVSVLSLLAKMLGFIREISLGNVYGANSNTDIYFYTFKISIAVFLSAGGIITTTLIPRIIDEEKTNNEIINKVLTLLLTCSAVLLVILYFFAPHLVQLTSPFQGEQKKLAIDMLRILFSTIVFFPLIYVYMSLLHTKGIFLPNNLSSVLFNLIIIIYILFWGEKYGIVGLGIIILVGWFLQFFVLVLPVRNTGYVFRLKWPKKEDNFKEMYSMFIPLFFIISLFGLLNIGDTMSATNLKAGEMSILNFAFSLFGALATAFVMAISTVIFPDITRKMKSMNDTEINEYLVKQLNVLLIVFLPMIVGVFFLGDELIRFFYGFTKEFKAEDFLKTSDTLKIFFLGLISFGVVEILSKTYIAKKKMMFPCCVSILAVILNYFGNVLVANRYGTKGIAMVTSLVLFVVALVYITNLKIKWSGLLFYIRSFLPTIIMGISLYILQWKVELEHLLLNIALQLIGGVISYLLGLSIIFKTEISLILKNGGNK
jgi:putative peptidoglycan lipid II flippase